MATHGNAKRKNLSGNKKENPAKQRRTEQLEQIRAVIAVLESHREKHRSDQRSHGRLDSVSLGMYEEIDKLTKKAPAEQITPLVLEQVNDVIQETKQLVCEDPYVQKLVAFVPAGDLPQLRDVLFVIRQVRQGLTRFVQELVPKEKTLSNYIQEAYTVKAALEFFLQGYASVSPDKIREQDISVSDKWMTGVYSEKYFNFDRLDTMKIPEYFQLS